MTEGLDSPSPYPAVISGTGLIPGYLLKLAAGGIRWWSLGTENNCKEQTSGQGWPWLGVMGSILNKLKNISAKENATP